VLFRLFFMFLLFVLGRLFGPGARRGTFGGGPSGGGDAPPRPGRSGAGTSRNGVGAKPPIDRSDVVDVPFTEVPPSGGGPAGASSAGASGASSGASGASAGATAGP